MKTMDWFKLGTIYFKKGKYLKAINTFKKSYETSKNDNELRIKSLIAIGDSLKFALEFELADKIYKNALKLAKKDNHNKLIPLISENINLIYV